MTSIGNALLAEIIKPQAEAIIKKYVNHELNKELVDQMSAELKAISPLEFTLLFKVTGHGDLLIDIDFPTFVGDNEHPLMGNQGDPT